MSVSYTLTAAWQLSAQDIPRDMQIDLYSRSACAVAAIKRDRMTQEQQQRQMSKTSLLRRLLMSKACLKIKSYKDKAAVLSLW